MSDAFTQANSLLAIEVGTVTTRAFLFDAVEGSYRLVALGTSPTTLDYPLRDASEGVYQALDQLHAVSGRTMVHPDTGIIVPTDRDGNGVDAFVATLSAGKPLKAIAIGLLEDVSLRSAENLLGTLYTHLEASLSMNDRRRLEERLDAILQAQPDLILIAGGTEGGASKSVSRQVEAVGLACYLLPDNIKPQVVFAGNSNVAADVQADLSGFVPVHLAPNVRPTLENEHLLPAQNVLREVFKNLRFRDNAPLKELNTWSSNRLMPATHGFARVIRFFSQYYSSPKGVLGIDLGAASVSVVAAFSQVIEHKVYTDLGMGHTLPQLLQHTRTAEIARWTPYPTPEDDVLAYIHNKAIYPASLPTTLEEIALEHALAREVLRVAIRRSEAGFPAFAARSAPHALPWFEPVVVSGSTLTHAPTRAQTLMMLLDGLQLTGITTVVSDQFNILSALGAAAEIEPLLAVQVIDSGALVNLAAVIVPVANVRAGAPVLRVRVTNEAGEENKLEVAHGAIERIKLHPGEEVKLSLQPLNRADIGMGRPGQGGTLKVKAGELGIVIDARGRPLKLPSDPSRRRELLQKWMSALES